MARANEYIVLTTTLGHKVAFKLDMIAQVELSFVTTVGGRTTEVKESFDEITAMMAHRGLVFLTVDQRMAR